MTVRPRRRFDAVDEAIAQLVRLVLDDAWTAVTAAIQLRARVQDEAVLHRARARVALAEPASGVAERAAATLDRALSLGHPQPEGMPALATAHRAGSEW